MQIEYLHASVYGNGVAVAKEFADRMAARGVSVSVHHIEDVKPTALPPADLYLFSSPGRFGRPIGAMRRFLKKVRLPAGTAYAILATGLAPQPNPKTGAMPSEDELGACERVVPVMKEMLEAKGLVEVAEDKVLVTGIKGPLEEGWREKVESFVARIPTHA
jgi:hypothetical protein